jgi:hypothetical protein
MLPPVPLKGELRFKKVYKIDVSLCVEFLLLNKEQKDERSVATKA